MCGDVASRGVLVHSFHIPACLHCEVVAKRDVRHHLGGFQHQVGASVHMVVLCLVALCFWRAYQCLQAMYINSVIDSLQTR